MSVKINDLPGRQVHNSGTGSRVSASGNTGGHARSGATTPGHDQFSLTRSAAQLKALEAQIAAQPVVDAQRVSGVQRAVATGSFQFQPEVAADNMLTQEREFAQLEMQGE